MAAAKSVAIFFFEALSTNMAQSYNPHIAIQMALADELD
jgi:hypothetical protein